MSDIPVIITRRRTSRITIRITKDCQVRVSAPRLMPRSSIERFVEEHRIWIDKNLKKTAQRQQKREDFYAGLDISTPKLRKEAVGKLDAIVAPLVEKYSELMGVKPAGISYRATKSRWGSCNAKTRHINFSTYLVLLPDWCIEHIVVHEMAHLLEPNHGPRFYAIMDRYFPRWKEARKATAI